MGQDDRIGNRRWVASRIGCAATDRGVRGGTQNETPTTACAAVGVSCRSPQSTGNPEGNTGTQTTGHPTVARGFTDPDPGTSAKRYAVPPSHAIRSLNRAQSALRPIREPVAIRNTRRCRRMDPSERNRRSPCGCWRFPVAARPGSLRFGWFPAFAGPGCFGTYILAPACPLVNTPARPIFGGSRRPIAARPLTPPRAARSARPACRRPPASRSRASGAQPRPGCRRFPRSQR